jgi:hypothetical protein
VLIPAGRQGWEAPIVVAEDIPRMPLVTVARLTRSTGL